MDVLVKVSKGSRNVYEIEEERRLPRIKNILEKTAPGDYGNILKASSFGGLGCLVLTEEPSMPCSIIPVKAIGSFEVVFEDASDHEIIAVPIDDETEDIKSVSKQKLKEMIEFIEHYKTIETGKRVKVKAVENSEVASKILKRAFELFKNTG